MDSGWIQIKKASRFLNLVDIFFKKGKKMNSKKDAIFSVIAGVFLITIFIFNAKVDSMHASIKPYQPQPYDQYQREVLMAKN